MTNVRCKGNKEIDLLAIHPKTLKKYHVESRVTTTFKLRLKATYTKKGRCHRNGVDFFLKNKFDHPFVLEKIHEIFGNVPYEKWLVVWTVQDDSVTKEAYKKFGIEVRKIWQFVFQMIKEGKTRGSRDDVLRIIEFMSKILAFQPFG